MVFLHITDEGHPVRTGFNFYPFRSGQIGFRFVFRQRVGFYVRFNRKIRRLSILRARG